MPPSVCPTRLCENLPTPLCACVARHAEALERSTDTERLSENISSIHLAKRRDILGRRGSLRRTCIADSSRAVGRSRSKGETWYDASKAMQRWKKPDAITSDTSARGSRTSDGGAQLFCEQHTHVFGHRAANINEQANTGHPRISWPPTVRRRSFK